MEVCRGVCIQFCVIRQAQSTKREIQFALIEEKSREDSPEKSVAKVYGTHIFIWVSKQKADKKNHHQNSANIY